MEKIDNKVDINASKNINQDFDDLQCWKNYFTNKLKKEEIKIESDEFFKDRTPCFIPDPNFMKESTFLANFGDDIISNKNISFVKETVFLEDRRTKVESVNKFPFSAIGFIIFETQDGQKQIGTGTLISSNLVLTCAHNVFDNEENKNYINHEFYIGLEDGIYREKSKVKNFFFADEYKDDNNLYKNGDNRDNVDLNNLKGNTVEQKFCKNNPGTFNKTKTTRLNHQHGKNVNTYIFIYIIKNTTI